MRLQTLELFNFCQYEYRLFEFGEGVTALLGRNGAGKSNAIKGLYAALTGDFSRNAGIKTDNVRQQAAEDQRAGVVIHFQHGGSEIRVERWLRPNGCRLEVDGQERTRRATEIDQLLREILGTDLGVIGQYVVIDQWQMFDFISASAAQRAQAFAQLFRTDRLEQIWTAAGERLSRLRVPTPEVSRNVLENSQQQEQQRRQSLIEQLERIGDLPGEAYVVDQDPYQAQLRSHQEAQGLAADLEKLQRIVEADETEVQRRTQALQEIQDRKAASAIYLRSKQEAYQAAQTTLRDWERYEQYAPAELSAKQRWKTARTSWSQRSPLPPADPQWDREDLAIAVADGQKEISRLQQVVTTLSADGVVACPVCGTPTDQVDVGSYCQQLEARQAAQPDLERRRTAANQRFQQMQWRREQRTGVLRPAWEHLQHVQRSAVPYPSQPRQEARALLTEYENVLSGHEQLELDYKTEDRARGAAAYLRDERRATLRDLEQRIQGLGPGLDATRLVELREASQLLVQSYSERHTARAQLATSEQNLQRIATALEELEKLETNARRITGWRETLEQLRELTHRDRLPRQIASLNLRRLQTSINDLLQHFGNPFLVEFDPETLQPVCTFPDGVVTPAARLSGGQKMLVAVAFRLAINSMFAGDLGVLILDEPTAGMDAPNVEHFGTAMAQLRQISRTHGLQVVIVTHEQALASAFDQVISIA